MSKAGIMYLPLLYLFEFMNIKPIPVVVSAHVISIIIYMYYGNGDSIEWSNFYYTNEKLFTVFALIFSLSQKKDKVDRWYMYLAIGVNFILFAFFVIASYSSASWVNDTTYIIGSVITWSIVCLFFKELCY